MNSIKEKLKKYNFKIQSLKYIGKVVIIKTDKGVYLYKEGNNYAIYNYLASRNFPNYPLNISNKNDNYDLVEFLEDTTVSKEQRLHELINIVSLLHKKTSFNREFDLDKLKQMYENIQNDANYLMNYYSDLNNYIDNITFMSPAEYLLVSNIDLFYYLISFVKVASTNWYDSLKKKKVMRYSMIHNNLSLSHIVINDKLNYLVSWNKAKLDMPIWDLKKIIEDNYYDLGIESFISEYEKENRLNEDEYLFLLINLALPKKIEFTNNTYQDCYNLSNYLVYLQKNASLIHKYDKKIQKS